MAMLQLLWWARTLRTVVTKTGSTLTFPSSPQGDRRPGVHGCRKDEIRGFLWDDYDGYAMEVKQSVWRNHVGEPKGEKSKRRPAK